MLPKNRSDKSRDLCRIYQEIYIMYKNIYIWIHVCIYTRMYIYVYVHMYIYKYKSVTDREYLGQIRGV